MALKGEELNRNAGEWAELYVLLKTLADGKLYAADDEIKKIPHKFMPVISINMAKASTKEPISYVIDANKREIKLIVNGKEHGQVAMEEFYKEARGFFEIISTRKATKSGKKLVFSVPEIAPFLHRIGYPETKKSSDKKADIHMIVHDIMTGYEDEVGFSIKSKHSEPPTLINPSGQTLFKYKIVKKDGSIDINDLNEAFSPSPMPVRYGPKNKFPALFAKGYDIEFVCVKGDEFSENLNLIDSNLPQILGESLKHFMTMSGGDLTEVVDWLAKSNPCQFKTSKLDRVHDFYEYKIKKLIVDAALGMTPKAPWNGKFDASGGYIVVKECGDVLCYHLYNWNALQEYLFRNLKFDTPASSGKGSKKSYKYAYVYEENGEKYVDICLQLRFK